MLVLYKSTCCCEAAHIWCLIAVRQYPQAADVLNAIVTRGAPDANLCLAACPAETCGALRHRRRAGAAAGPAVAGVLAGAGRGYDSLRRGPGRRLGRLVLGYNREPGQHHRRP